MCAQIVPNIRMPFEGHPVTKITLGFPRQARRLCGKAMRDGREMLMAPGCPTVDVLMKIIRIPDQLLLKYHRNSL